MTKVAIRRNEPREAIGHLHLPGTARGCRLDGRAGG
jgi:hypothetical protein